MKYIKNGKVVLDGTIKECDLEEKLLRALEIIIDKEPDLMIIKTKDTLYDYFLYTRTGCMLTQNEFDLLREIAQWN